MKSIGLGERASLLARSYALSICVIMTSYPKIHGAALSERRDMAPLVL